MSFTTPTSNEQTMLSILKKLSDEIHNSWIKDAARIEELLQIRKINEEIKEKDSIESYFEDQKTLEFFLTTYSKEIINNILRQHIIYGENGDDVALSVLNSFIELMIKFIDNPKYNQLFDSVIEIFDSTKHYYKTQGIGGGKSTNPLKYMSSDKYNSTLPKLTKDIQIEVGDMIDVLADNFKKHHQSSKEKLWTRGRVISKNEDEITVVIAETPVPERYTITSLEIAEVGTMTPDYDWRTNLKEGDLVDCLDRGKIYPSTILKATKKLVNDLPYVEYRVGFRVFCDEVEDWIDFSKFWPNKTKKICKESKKTFLGDEINLDETIPFFSRRLLPIYTHKFWDGKTKAKTDEDDYRIDDYICYLNEDGSKNIVIGRSTNFSFYYTSIIKNMAEKGFFEKVTDLLGENIALNGNVVYYIFSILSRCCHMLHKKFIAEISPSFHSKMTNYLLNLKADELRNIKKDMLDTILKILNNFLNLTYSPSEVEEKLTEFNIKFSIKLLTSTVLDKRIQAIKTLTDTIRKFRSSPEKTSYILDIIHENKIFNEIYGSNSHIQLMKNSKELLEILLKEDKISDEEINVIWNGTKKGDLEGKLTILKLFSEISYLLQSKHVQRLYSEIITGDGEDLIQEEIDLFVSLSNHPEQPNNIKESCIDFLKKCLFNRDFATIEKTEISGHLIKLLFSTATDSQELFHKLIKETLEDIKNNNHILHCFLIIKESLTQSRIDCFEFYVENKLDEIALNCLVQYNSQAKIRFENNPKAFNQENHSLYLNNLIVFLRLLDHNMIFNDKNKIKETLYETLFLNAITVSDSDHFYNYISRLMSTTHANYLELFNFFRDRIVNSTEQIQKFTILGFKCLLEIFVSLNVTHDKMEIRDETLSETKTSFVEPTTLLGYDLIWNIMIESFSLEILEVGIGLIIELNNNCRAQGVTAQEIQQKLIDKCIILLNQVDEDENYESKCNKIKKCLKILTIMIEESEKQGTANVKSHGSILKHKAVNLKINSKSYKLQNTEVKTYANTTIWDLKCLIAKKLEVCVDFIKLFRKNEKVEDKHNGKMISELEIRDGEILEVSLISIDKLIPKVELVRNSEIVPELIQVFTDWFNTFNVTGDGKMKRKECGKFVKAVLECREEVLENDDRVSRVYNTCKTDEEGYLVLEGFIDYFREAALSPSRQATLWDNLHTMGIRNDLKKYSDPYHLHNNDKNLLPRFFFGHNSDLFNSIFKLQEQAGEIGEVAHNFLNVISTNPDIYMDILGAFSENSDKINLILDPNNVYKLLYSLQIIESFIEELDIETKGVDILEGQQEIAVNEKYSAEEIEIQKATWIESFLKNEGFHTLLNILIKQLEMINKNLNEGKNLSKIERDCSEFLIKIIKIFFFTAIVNKQEFMIIDDEDLTNLERKGSNLDRDRISSIFKGDSASKIINNQNLPSFARSLVSLLEPLLNLESIIENDSVINNAFDFLCGLILVITSDDDTSLIDTIKPQLLCVFKIGITNNIHSLRQTFSSSLIRTLKQAYSSRKHKLLAYFVDLILGEVLPSNLSSETKTFELFSIINVLTSLFLSDDELKDNCHSSYVLLENFLNKMLNDIDTLLSSDNRSELSAPIYIDYFNILVKVCNINDDFRRKVTENTQIFNNVLYKILFVSENAQDNKAEIKFVDLDEKIKEENANSSSSELMFVCYDLIVSLIKSDIKLYEQLFSIDVLDEKKQEKEKESVYSISYGKKVYNHVGLRNLGCICYMNSMLQQFFMIPTLRKGLLQVTDGVQEKKDNLHKVDDNVLHQLQRMFSFLTYSERQDYNPHGFCFALKDWDGNPTNTMIQQDTQEFLNRILDVVENQIKPTPLRNIFNDVCAGKLISQLICEEGCNTVRNNFEDFYNLSLEVNNMKNLNDSLEKLISHEKIDEYHCETCNKKVTITKRNSIGCLPNTLIVHLQRITYDFEYDRNKKINSRLEFPREISLKQYTIEEILRKNAEKTGSVFEETEHIYFKEDEYYEYYLTGVVIHMGSADSGHYYSYINTIREGKGNVAEFDPSNKNHCDSWLEYNDSRISPFNPKDLESECFGGSYESTSNYIGGFKHEKSQSAYILTYERKLKTPVKVLLENQGEKTVIEFEEEQKDSIMKKYNWLRRMDQEERKEIEESITNSVFFDIKRKEYYDLVPFYNLKTLIPKEYYEEIKVDNQSLKKHMSVRDDKFLNFFKRIMEQLTQTFANIDLKKAKSTEICGTLINFIFKILANKDRENLLEGAVTILNKIIEEKIEVAEYVLDYLTSNQHNLKKHLLCESFIIPNQIVQIVDKTLKQIHSVHKFSLLEEPKTLLHYNYIELIKLTFGMFPRIPERLAKYSKPLMIVSF